MFSIGIYIYNMKNLIGIFSAKSYRSFAFIFSINASNPKIKWVVDSFQVKHRRNSITFSILFTILSFQSGLRAQNHTYTGNAEYGNNGGMNQFKVTEGEHFSTTATDDPRIIITAECAAANNYGVWTVSSGFGSNVEPVSGIQNWIFSPNQYDVLGSGTYNPNGKSGWLLLGNLIAKPSEKYVTSDATHPGCQPPGVVSGGDFNNPNFSVSQCQVAANLNGSVRYVVVDPGSGATARTDFFLSGLNDQRGISGDQEIDIKLDGLPNPAKQRQIVQQVIHSYIHATAYTNDGVNTHVVDNGEADPRDEFDIAMDKKFLYIVWNSSGNIYATAILLSTGAAWQSAFLVGTGTRPTVACDVRNNPTTPFFAIAYINGGNVMAGEYSGNTAQNGGPKPLLKKYNDPITAGFDNYICNATHARIVVSSVRNVTRVTGVYVRECDELILFNNLGWATNSDGIHWDDKAWYVDGKRAYNCMGSDPLPSPIPPSTGGHYNCVNAVEDKPIIAFANPYDNQSGTYNQFHCMYQLIVNNFGSVIEKPLILVRGADNGFGNNPGGNTSDTRLLLDRTGGAVQDNGSNLTSYCGAINQMGIHTYWKIGADHYYARDKRTFDEEIEEYTLVTNDCSIADGNTGHGGTAGTKLLGGVKFTIWSDPNYGAVDGGSTTSGMYWQYPNTNSATGFFGEALNVGSLSFSSASLALTVGASDGSTMANLYTMPVCDIAKIGSDGMITVNKGSTWDCYGSAARPDWNGPGWKNLNVNLNGPSTGPVTPNLNIHGGAVFWECNALNCNYAMINILYDADVYLIGLNPSCSLVVDMNNHCSAASVLSTNCPKTGLLRIGVKAIIDHSNINSFIPMQDWFDDEDHLTSVVLKNVVMLITTKNGYGNSSNFTLNSTYNTYTNFAHVGDVPSGGAGSIILYDGRTCSDNGGPDKVVLDHDILNRIRFHGVTPGNGGLELTYLHIKDWDLVPIFIENGLNGACIANVGYNDVTVENNIFENLIAGACTNVGDHPFDPAQGILIRNFNTTGRFSQVNVNNNDFSYYEASNNRSLPSGYAAGYIETAIEFDKSTGNIMNNTITEDLFFRGIWVHNDFNSDKVQPYLCNNTVKDQTGVFILGLVSDNTGIESDHYTGYVNLNTIDGCTIGYMSDASDIPLIVHTTITNSKHYGIYLYGVPHAEVDLRGIHSPTPCTTCYDFAANNNISNNGSASNQAQITLGDQNQLIDLGKLPGSSWGSWGKNQIITSGTPKLISTFSLTQANIGSIDNNNWGSIDPYTPACPEAHFSVIYTCGETKFSPWFDSSSWFSCSCYSGSQGIGSKNAQPLSSQSTIDTCIHLRTWAAVYPSNEEVAQKQYDTLKLYIEKCGLSDSTSWQIFTHLDAANQFRSNDTNIYYQYRSWLLSVLYLNTIVPQYFCECMAAIMSTYQKTVEVLAIMNYLRTYHRECWGPPADKQYAQDSATAVHYGYDVKYLPSMKDLGLDSILRLHDGVQGFSSYLASFTSTPNPFSGETTLQFTLNRMTYISVSVYDELGRLVWGDGKGSSLETGVHQVHIDGKNLPSGTLYARISTGFGEVKTLKLVHKK